ncbi:uncharacterized protein LOC131876603 [Cryptomeria japonica]|uniref:uncharacterized protein LOC131876603 n=1 Tax=Cryptomeria japonica TaxID=3369 RepID=UPI0027DA871F|nr:uncharacterized protein LOC131876603 [Cryptomeria japonica]
MRWLDIRLIRSTLLNLMELNYGQAIMEILEYTKTVRDLCTHKQKKKMDPKIVQVIGQLVDLMLGNLTVPKYVDLASPMIKKEDNLFYSIYYIRKNFIGEEVNYMVTEKKFLVVVYAINKFHHYITRYKVFVHTDHFAIQFLMNKPVVTSREIRWLLFLQEFDITILDKSGRENVVADFLSRLQQQDELAPVDDTFLDENLFAISAKSPLFVDIENYLATCLFPSHFSPWEH